MDELKLDMDEILDPLQRMDDHLRTRYPTLGDGERLQLAAQVLQAALLSEQLRWLVSLEQGVDAIR